MYCPNCGKQVPEGARFCDGCGNALPTTAPTMRPPRKSSPIVIFGGGFLILVLLFALLSDSGGRSPTSALQQTAFGSTAFEIRVTGTTGKRFSGSYMVMSGDGSSTSHSVEDVIPRTYTVPAAMVVSVAFQKQTTDGTLAVEILRNGERVKSNYTLADYGMVTIATQ